MHNSGLVILWHTKQLKYHSHCLVKLYNSSNRKVEEGKKEKLDTGGVSRGIALVELIASYIEETKNNAKDVAPI